MKIPHPARGADRERTARPGCCRPVAARRPESGRKAVQSELVVGGCGNRRVGVPYSRGRRSEARAGEVVLSEQETAGRKRVGGKGQSGAGQRYQRAFLQHPFHLEAGGKGGKGGGVGRGLVPIVDIFLTGATGGAGNIAGAGTGARTAAAGLGVKAGPTGRGILHDGHLDDRILRIARS